MQDMPRVVRHRYGIEQDGGSQPGTGASVGLTVLPTPALKRSAADPDRVLARRGGEGVRPGCAWSPPEAAWRLSSPKRTSLLGSSVE